MRKGVVLGVLILAFIVIAGVLFFPGIYDRSNDAGSSGEAGRTTDNDNSAGGGVNNRGSIGGFASQGDQQGEVSENLNQNQGCSSQQISYAVKDLIITEECLEYNGECIRKNVECSFDVYNLDRDVSGLFGFNLYVVEEAGNGAVIDSSYLESFINAMENASMRDEFSIIGENAAGDLTCVYAKEKIPKKEVC